MRSMAESEPDSLQAITAQRPLVPGENHGATALVCIKNSADYSLVRIVTQSYDDRRTISNMLLKILSRLERMDMSYGRFPALLPSWTGPMIMVMHSRQRRSTLASLPIDFPHRRPASFTVRRPALGQLVNIFTLWRAGL